jgi:phospholysine phosphohistidine inorganic pyrophosphate phosphatase
MTPRRPPDILRKSHAHTEGKGRAKDKRALERAVDESIGSPLADRALLIDLDGVVYRAEEPIEGAAEAILHLREARVPHLFVTNTTSRPRSALVEKLARFGIDVREDEILAPPDAAADWLAEHDCRRLLLLVPEATAAAFEGFEIVTPDAADAADAADADAADADVTEGPATRVDAVVVGDLGRGWTFDRLNTAFRYLMRKPAPKLVALGMTRYWHAPDGLRLDTAPFVVALAHASGVEPTVLGKPAQAFFDAALARLGVGASEAAMVGDDIRTDVAGAKACGLAGILVRTGKFRPTDLEQGVEPDLVIDSIAELAQLIG